MTCFYRVTEIVNLINVLIIKLIFFLVIVKISIPQHQQHFKLTCLRAAYMIVNCS